MIQAQIAHARRLPTRERLWILVSAAVLSLGVALRCYHIAAQRMREDELYTVDLVQRGFLASWLNATYEHSLPLSNLLFWLAGQVSVSELSLRLVSVIASALGLLVYYFYCTKLLGRRVGLLATGLYAVAPLAVIYAQDARPYALPSLAIVLTFVGYERVRELPSRRNWAIYIALAVFAAQCHYSVLPMIGGQLLALVALAPRRRAALAGGALATGACVLSLAPFLGGATKELQGWLQAYTGGLALAPSMETMLIGDMPAWAITGVVALGAVAIGSLLALVERRNRLILLPHLLQILLLLLTAFVVMPLLGHPIPAFEGRQFILLLPSALICFSLGVGWLAERRFGRPLALALLAALFVVSGIRQSYYFGTYKKSRLGLFAASLAAETEPGDVAVLSCPLDGLPLALRFYDPNLMVYRCDPRQPSDGTLMYDAHPNAFPMALRPMRLDQLTGRQRIWLITQPNRSQPVALPQPLFHLQSVYQYDHYLAQLFVRYPPDSDATLENRAASRPVNGVYAAAPNAVSSDGGRSSKMPFPPTGAMKQR